MSEQATDSWATESDPLYWLLKRFKLASPWRCALAYGILTLASHAAFFCVLYIWDRESIGPAWGGESSLSNIVYAIAVTPLAAFFYAWISGSSQRLFRDLRSAPLGVAGDGKEIEVFDERAGIVARVLMSSWVPLATLGVTLIPSILETYNVWYLDRSLMSPGRPPSQFALRASSLSYAVPAFIGWFMVTMIGLRELLVIRGLNEVFRRLDVKLNPLHPDGYGGLRPINEYALHVSYFIGVAGFGLAIVWLHAYKTGVLRSNPVLIPATAMYLVATPTIFFCTLGSAHLKMRAAKETFLKDVSEAFVAELEDVNKAVKGNASNLEPQLVRIRQLRELHGIAAEFPVWPFDMASLRNFTIMLIAPVSPLIVSKIAAWFSM